MTFISTILLALWFLMLALVSEWSLRRWVSDRLARRLLSGTVAGLAVVGLVPREADTLDPIPLVLLPLGALAITLLVFGLGVLLLGVLSAVTRRSETRLWSKSDSRREANSGEPRCG